MGVKNLFKLITQHAPNSISTKSIKNYSGKYVVLDASMIIYQYVIAIRSSGSDLKNTNGQMTSHILGVLSKTFMLLKNNIIPIFVFDGKPPNIKLKTIKNRKEKKKKNLEKMEQTDDNDERIKYFKRSFTMTHKHTREVKEILNLFGIPVIEAPSEADPLCAHIVYKKLAYGVISEDMDMLVFGCPKLIRKLSSKKKSIEIHLSIVLRDMGLTLDELIDLSILLGCDYSNTIPKIGLKRAYEIIKKYKSIDKFIEQDDKIKNGFYKIPKDFNYIQAREFFKNPPIKNITKNNVKLKKPKYNKIKEIMVQVYNFKLNKVNQYLNLIRKSYNRLNPKKNNQINNYIT